MREIARLARDIRAGFCCRPAATPPAHHLYESIDVLTLRRCRPVGAAVSDGLMFRPFLVSVRWVVTLAHLYVHLHIRLVEAKGVTLGPVAYDGCVGAGGAADRAQCHAVKEAASPAAS